jgi:RES domain-containing protein
MLDALILLDGATNERIQGEHRGQVGIDTIELVFGISSASVVNAAFIHTGDGARFNDSTRGAWYAAFELETSIAEVSYHKKKRLADIVAPDEPRGRPAKEVVTYDDWLADFKSEFHTLDPATAYVELLQAEPVPECYATPQRFARQLLDSKSNGIIYPSVRKEGRHCLVCFRPALVINPRFDQRLEFTFTDSDTGYECEVPRVTT